MSISPEQLAKYKKHFVRGVLSWEETKVVILENGGTEIDVSETIGSYESYRQNLVEAGCPIPEETAKSLLIAKLQYEQGLMSYHEAAILASEAGNSRQAIEEAIGVEQWLNL